MTSAIILDSHLKSALSAVRSLGAAGIFVSAGAERGTAMALHSKYSKTRFIYPSPLKDTAGFIGAVKEEAIRMAKRPVVYAFSDATYLTLFAHRERLADSMILVFPELSSVEIAFDKAATYSLAKVSGIPTITTYTPELKEEVEHLGTTLTFPAVVKPRRSVAWVNNVGKTGTASFVHSRRQLIKNFFALKERFGESPLVQDLLIGEEYGVEMLAYKGVVHAIVTHHRIRSLSPTGGASVLKETVQSGELKNSLETYAKILVEKLSWSGPIMVEFKVDSDSREPKLMEVNGRFWGSLPLSVAAGVDMPHLYYYLATGSGLPENAVTARDGVITRHFLGDIRHLLRVLFVPNAMRKILYPKRSKALADFFSIPRGTKSDVWSRSDMKPTLMEFVDVFLKALH